MDKPSKDGASQDCWSTSLGSLDPHYSSGSANHLFYLASEGTGAKTINGVTYNSPTCNGSTVTGIGRDKAAKIWYRALSTYLTSSSNYAAARERRDQVGHGPVRRLQRRVHRRSPPPFTRRSPVPAGAETCGGGTDAAADRQQPAAQPRLRVRRGQLDRHRRPDHQQHRPPGPHRQLEALARRQRHDRAPRTSASRSPSRPPPPRRRCRSGCASTPPRPARRSTTR